MRRKVTISVCLILMQAVPIIDQFACFYCGPTAENSMTLETVPHTEDDCILKDGFEKEDADPGTAPTHIHFCILHSTAIDLTVESPVLQADGGSKYSGEILAPRLNPFAAGVFHPPTFA